MTASATAPRTRRVTVSSRKAANVGRAYLATFVGLTVVVRTFEGEPLVGVVESFDACGRPVVRFPDGRWMTGSLDLAVVVE